MDKLPTVGQKSSVKWKNLDYTIVDNSKVIGLISIGDVVKEMIVKQKKQIEELQKYISGQLRGSNLVCLLCYCYSTLLKTA